MIHIAITEAAFDAIFAALPIGNVGYENQTNERGDRLIWLDHAVVARRRAMRGPGESYSDVILWVAGSSGAPDVLGCTPYFQTSCALSYRASALARRGGTRP